MSRLTAEKSAVADALGVSTPLAGPGYADDEGVPDEDRSLLWTSDAGRREDTVDDSCDSWDVRLRIADSVVEMRPTRDCNKGHREITGQIQRNVREPTQEQCMSG